MPSWYFENLRLEVLPFWMDSPKPYEFGLFGELAFSPSGILYGEEKNDAIRSAMLFLA